jgi:hypothetical protein
LAQATFFSGHCYPPVNISVRSDGIVDVDSAHVFETGSDLCPAGRDAGGRKGQFDRIRSFGNIVSFLKWVEITKIARRLNYQTPQSQ